MALAQHRYRNPEQVAATDERYAIREKHGCAACLHRDKDILVFGKAVCGVGKQPGKRGFCPVWWLDKEWSE